MIKNQFRRTRTITPAPAPSRILYSNCDIPAKLFFDEVCNGNLSVLGEGTPAELEAANMSIIDEYCEIDNNVSFKEAFTLEEKISGLLATIEAINLAVHTIAYDQLLSKEDRLEMIANLTAFKKPKITFNLDAPIINECNRIATKIVGSLKNNLNQLIAQRKKERTTRNKIFHKSLAALKTVLAPIMIEENVSLRMFLEYEKIATERSKK